MNRRIRPVFLLAAVLLCLFTVGFAVPAALAQESATPLVTLETPMPPAVTQEGASPDGAADAALSDAGETSTPETAENTAAGEANAALIVVPLRIKALEKADENNAVLNELLYALNILRYSDTLLTFVPLQGVSVTDPVYQIAEHVPAADTGAYQPQLTGNITSIDKDAVAAVFADTFAALMAQLETQTEPVTVLIVQADTNGFSAAQLQEVLSYPLVNVVMLSVQGAEPSVKLDDFLRELGIADLQAGLEPNMLISLTPQLQVMKLTNDGVSAVYGALETLLLNASTQARLSLKKTETETASTVLLPAKGAANVLLVLKNLPQGTEVVITDESGTVITPKRTDQSEDRAMYELENIGGMLTVAAHALQPAQPQPSAAPAAGGAETTAEETAQEAADLAAQTEPSATPAAGDAETPLPSQSPAAVDAAPETPAPAATAQSVPGAGVEGTVLFTFTCPDTLQLSAQTGGTAFNKNEAIALTLEPLGDILPAVIAQDFSVDVQLHIRDDKGNEAQNPVAIGDGQSVTVSAALPEPGVYTVWATLTIGDFYMAASNILTLTVDNRPPVLASVPGLPSAYDFWVDDPFDPAALDPIDLSPFFTDPDSDPLTYQISPDANGPFSDTLSADSAAVFSIAGSNLNVSSPAAAPTRTVYVRASDADGGFADLALPITFHSVYDALASVTLGTPQISSAIAAKYAQVLISVEPQFPDTPTDGGLIRKRFLDHAAVKCVLQQNNGVTTTLSMTFDPETGMYQLNYPMPEKAVEYTVNAAYEIAAPGDDARYETLTGESVAATLTSLNTAPRWEPAATVGGADAAFPAKVTMEDNGNGELVDVTLDFTQLFADTEDALPGAVSQLTGFVRVTDSRGRGYALTETADGVYLLTKQAADTAEPAFLALPNAAQVTLRFQNAGTYTLHLAAADPDGLSALIPDGATMVTPDGAVVPDLSGLTAEDMDTLTAAGTLSIEVVSPTLTLYLIIGLSVSAALALTGLVLLVIRLLKPAFGSESLRVELRTPAVSCQWAVPLEAWKKRAVPLQWVLLYGCVPPLPELKEVETSVLLKPSRYGVKIITKRKTLQWVSGSETMRRTFVQGDTNPPVTLRHAELTLTLSLQGVSRRRPL